MRKRLVFIAFLIALFTLVPATPAWAYIDPATTTYLIQIATALVITLGVSLSIFLYRFQMIITNARVFFHALMRRLDKTRGGAGAAPGLSGEMSDAQAVPLSEDEALAAGILDYPIPVCESYPALALYSSETSASNEEETAADKADKAGRLRRFGTWLWGDKRSFKQRLPVSALLGGGLSMTYMLFPMFDTMIANEAEIPFFLGDVIGLILLLGILAFVVLTLFLAFLRGRLFDLAVCVTLSFLICGYLQITFFNSSIGQLMGTPLGWEELGVQTVLINLLIWIAVFVAILLFGLVRKTKRHGFFMGFSRFIPALIIAVQLITLLVIFPSSTTGRAFQTNGAEHESNRLYLTWEGINEVSSDGNVIIFILDAFDAEYANGVLDECPALSEDLDGFTYFPNNVAAWNSTYPSVINYLTGMPYDPNTPRSVYTKEAYSQHNFISDIRRQGYSANLYMESPHCYSDGTQLSGLADNLHTVSYTINATTAVKQLIKMNLLKVAPHALKFRFWLYSDIFDYAIEPSGPREAWIYKTDDIRFYEEIAQGLKVVNEPGHFTYYHLNGSHAPRIMNAQAQFVEGGVSPVEQTKGCFFILNEYFRQMKELGIYKDATIIITGDHPEHQMHKLLDKARPVGLFVKPSGSEGTPLQTRHAPVSIDNLRATCVQGAGGDADKWGRTYFEIGENEAIVRYYHHRYTATDGIHYTAVFRIAGDATDWKNWELVEQTIQTDDCWF